MKMTIPSNISFLKYSIRTRLILLFFLSTIMIFASAGYYLNWQIRATLDHALSQNVEAIASTFAGQIDPGLIVHIQPGDENSRTYRHVLQQFDQFKRVKGISRIYLFLADGASLVDSDSTVRIGQRYAQLNYSQQEMQEVFSGRTASSVLFAGVGGRLYKSGFAPIWHGDRVLAGIAVEASAEMLEAVDAIRNDLLILGVAVAIGAIFVGAIFANRITTPLKKLQHASEKISQGYFFQPIPDCGRDEVGFLSSTMEQMRQNILIRDKRQQAMLAGVAHEIRNPLGGIELCAGLLTNDIENHGLKKYAQKILVEVQHLKSIIQGFLDYARPNPAAKQWTDIRAVWDEVQFLLAGEMNAVTVSFTRARDAATLFVDPLHLKQIFLNLLKNSLIAVGTDGTIFVEIHRANDDVEIIFSDTGPGIPAELQSQIFEPFFTTREKGTGLGLAVVKNLVEENGGVIRYQEGEGGGACFVITFPIELMRR
ncbi:MAG: ATP-binding protein [Candidatus Zhuqueibacterota bacterium]